MKRKRALELQAAWGDQPCEHPTLAREYEEAARTGNYVCTACGKIFTFAERAQLLAGRAQR